MRRLISAALPLLLLACGAAPQQSAPAAPGSAPAAAPAGSPAAAQARASKMPVDRARMPEGFRLDVFAEDLPDARSLARGDGGTIFVGSRERGVVRALQDTDGDFRADVRHEIARGLQMPNGVAVRDGALYVAEVSRILRYDAIESHLADPPRGAVVTAGYPRDEWHGWKFIAFGPDGRLYVPVGAPCNTCVREDPYASITSILPDGTDMRIVARGVRNSVGFAWHPATKEMWFTDNGRDMLGDDVPSDELDRVRAPGLHFGFPYCHQGDVADPELGAGKDCATYEPPAAKLGAHVAALGMRFYQGAQFPAKYRGAAIIALHGSWNRTVPDGYRVVAAFFDDSGTKVTRVEPLVDGFLHDGAAWGRPVDVLELPDGSMLVSDDHGGAIYRLSWSGAARP